MDSNESGIINRELKLAKISKNDFFFSEPFLIDSFEGNWGFDNEIPIFKIRKKSVKPIFCIWENRYWTV